jgi:hypothetical protein
MVHWWVLVHCGACTGKALRISDQNCCWRKNITNTGHKESSRQALQSRIHVQFTRQAPEYHAGITPISPEYPKDINPKVHGSLNISIRKVVPTASQRGLCMQPPGSYSSISHHPHIHHLTTVTTQRIRGPTANDGSEDDFVPDDPRFVNCNPILIPQTCHNPTSRDCITTTFSVF